MTAPSLTPLLCLKCQTPLPARPDEAAWMCTSCGQGHLLDEDLAKGLAPLEIHFSTALPAGAPGRPFWVAQGQVGLKRETYSGNADGDARRFWTVTQTFLVPAFACPLEQMITLGMQLLRQPPPLQNGKPCAFAPVTLAMEDVRPMAEFIIMGIEAERRDKLKHVDFTLSLDQPALWILP